MEFTAKQIADVIGGRVEGDENAKIHTFAKIEEGKEGTITFLSNPKYTHFIYETKASIVLINNDVELEHPVSATLIRVPNAYECVAKLMQMYAASLPKKKGIDPLAFVSKTAEIGKDVYIGPFTYVGEGVKIGDGWLSDISSCNDLRRLSDWQQCHHTCRCRDWCRWFRLCPQPRGL